MRRKRRNFQHSNTQGYPLRDHIDLHHPLVELADMIDWAAIDRIATEPFQPGPGRPILRPRLIAGLHWPHEERRQIGAQLAQRGLG